MSPVDYRSLAREALPRATFVLDGDAGEDWKGTRKARRKAGLDARGGGTTDVKLVMFKRYVVTLDGDEIGDVFQDREHTYRSSGRLRYHDRYPMRWRWGRKGKNSYVGLYYTTRREATIDLIEEHLKED